MHWAIIHSLSEKKDSPNYSLDCIEAAFATSDLCEISKKTDELSLFLVIFLYCPRWLFSKPFSVRVSFEDRQDLLGHRSGRITTHYSSAELQNLYDAGNKVCEKQKSGVVLTLLRNPNNRKEKNTTQNLKVVSL